MNKTLHATCKARCIVPAFYFKMKCLMQIDFVSGYAIDWVCEQSIEMEVTQ